MPGISSISPMSSLAATSPLPSVMATKKELIGGDESQTSEARKQFDTLFGEVFYGQMLKAMRSTVDKPAYLHGGRGEEVFQQQLDQIVAQQMTQSNAHGMTGEMFEVFSAFRQQ